MIMKSHGRKSDIEQILELFVAYASRLIGYYYNPSYLYLCPLLSLATYLNLWSPINFIVKYSIFLFFQKIALFVISQLPSSSRISVFNF